MGQVPPNASLKAGDPQDHRDESTRGLEVRIDDIVLALALPMAAVIAPWLILGLVATPLAWLVLVPVELILLLVGVRQLNNYTTRNLIAAEAKGKERWPSRDVSPDELKEFQSQLEEYIGGSQFTGEQLDLFAVALAHPAVIRRRCTDRYKVGSRVLARETSIEFDLDLTLAPGRTPQLNPSRLAAGSEVPAQNQDASNAGNRGERSIFIPALLLRKGVLHDQSRFVDAAGNAVSALSYKEYRILAGLTLRRLLIAAYGSAARVRPAAWQAEGGYFALLLQFGIIEDGDDTTADRTKRVIKQLRQLKRERNADGNPYLDRDGKAYLDILIRFVRAVATHYAVVAVMPFDTSHRFFLTYESVEIPTIRRPVANRLARLRLRLGGTPLTFRLSVANAATCQSYHLLADGPKDTYLADFTTPFIKQNRDRQIPTDSRISYHRIRGRRGQSYFHLYSRIGTRIKASQLAKLYVHLRYHEVPPGSIGSAALSALVGFIACLAVAWASPGAVDGNVAVFLLALPGLAAVWLGLDASKERLDDAQNWTRVSLGCTFVASLYATILLLLQSADVAPTGSVMSGLVPHPLWLPALAITAVNAAISAGVLWQRRKYYLTLRERPAATSSYVYYV